MLTRCSLDITPYLPGSGVRSRCDGRLLSALGRAGSRVRRRSGSITMVESALAAVLIAIDSHGLRVVGLAGIERTLIVISGLVPSAPFSVVDVFAVFVVRVARVTGSNAELVATNKLGPSVELDLVAVFASSYDNTTDGIAFSICP